MQLDKSPHHREADTQAVLALAIGCGALNKHVEKPSEHLGRDTSPVVPDAERNPMSRSDRPQLDGPAGCGVFRRVYHDILDDLRQARRVSV